MVIMPWVELLWLAVALVALVASGRWLVHWLLIVTRAFGIPEFSVGFVLLAVSTSLPEIFVGIASARQGAASLVLATALGSNIVNMTFIVGLAAIVSLGIATAGLNVRRDLLLGGAITMLPILFLLDGMITRPEGGLLLAAFGVYVWRVYRQRRLTEARPVPGNPLKGLRALLAVAGLVVGLLVAAEVTVRMATSLAEQLQLPTFLIGLFVLAFGTSLPELVTTLNAALMRRPGLALGNILGSNVADSGVVVGLAALARPLEVALTPDLVVTGVFVLLSLLIIGWFAHTRRRLSVFEGLGLVGVFVIFSLLLFGVSATSLAS